MPVSFVFLDTATTEIYTLSLHDALPISAAGPGRSPPCSGRRPGCPGLPSTRPATRGCRTPSRSTRSEEHTSELQSLRHLVCRLLLEKKKKDENNSETVTQD